MYAKFLVPKKRSFVILKLFSLTGYSEVEYDVASQKMAIVRYKFGNSEDDNCQSYIWKCLYHILLTV